jgi:hypothetical protein
MEKDTKQLLKVRYSIETYEKLLVSHEEVCKTLEELRKSNEEIRKRVMMPEEDRVNGDSRDKVA